MVCLRVNLLTKLGVLVLFQVAALIIYNSQDIDPEPSVHLAGDTVDYSAEYRIIQFYKHQGIPQDYTYHDVSIATQCSVNHLHHLVELAERWKGPISCTVFAPNLDASYADDAIDILRKCFSDIRKYVYFHLVYPAQHPADVSKVGVWQDLSCSALLDKLQNYGYQNYVVGNIPFPHNILRNVARKGVITEFVLLIDIDTMPNLELRQEFNNFAYRHSLFGLLTEQTVFVVAAFEIKKGIKMPSNKTELLSGIRTGTVRTFHNETCWWCHRSENFDLWRKIPQVSNLEVAFYADWDKSWEPFYISHRNVPLFDERFKQYGFDRIQQICELHIAGYKFAVLNNAFVVHHGWKFRGNFYANKDKDNAQNWILFNYHFKDDLQKKYNTNRTCSPVELWIPPGKRRSAPQPISHGRGVVASRFKPNILKEGAR
ncbi:beta-1,4-glucuronyltransferase 1-like isoform X2 [Styela clava]